MSDSTRQLRTRNQTNATPNTQVATNANPTLRRKPTMTTAAAKATPATAKRITKEKAQPAPDPTPTPTARTLMAHFPTKNKFSPLANDVEAPENMEVDKAALADQKRKKADTSNTPEAPTKKLAKGMDTPQMPEPSQQTGTPLASQPAKKDPAGNDPYAAYFSDNEDLAMEEPVSPGKGASPSPLPSPRPHNHGTQPTQYPALDDHQQFPPLGFTKDDERNPSPEPQVEDQAQTNPDTQTKDVFMSDRTTQKPPVKNNLLTSALALQKKQGPDDQQMNKHNTKIPKAEEDQNPEPLNHATPVPNDIAPPIQDPVIDFTEILAHRPTTSPFKLTKIDPTKLPMIQVNLRRLLSNVTDEEKEYVKSQAGVALLGVAAWDSGSNELIFKYELFMGVLHERFGEHHNISLRPLDLLDPAGPNCGAPRPVIMENLSDEIYHTLVEEQFLDCDKGCIIIHETNIPLSGYIARFANLTTWDSEEACAKVIKMFASGLTANPVVCESLAEVANLYHDDNIEPKDCVLHLLRSARANCMSIRTKGGANTVPVWRLYIAPFTSNKALYTDFIVTVRALDYSWSDGMCVTLRVDPEYFCNICYAYDHPTGLCVCLNIPGFKGARYVPIKNEEAEATDPNTIFSSIVKKANGSGNRNNRAGYRAKNVIASPSRHRA